VSKQGDKIKVTRDGKLFVHGEERKGERSGGLSSIIPGSHRCAGSILDEIGSGREIRAL
jgi:hypothetical protein